MFDKFRPFGDRVLVKRCETEEKTASGLIIPDSAKEIAQTGKVLAVGTGKRDANGQLITPAVSVGETVYFGKYAGTETGNGFLIIREEEILGVVEL